MPQTNYRMNTITSLVVVSGVTVMLAAFGVSGVIASEVTGSLSAGSTGTGGSSSTSAGSVSGTVVGGSLASSGGSSPSPQTASSRSGGRSSSRQATIVGSDSGSSAIQDGSSSDASLTGTGGGYDPNLDAYLASSGGNSGTTGGISGTNLSPSDAVAYNGGVNPNALQNAAAAGATGTSGKVMTILLIGLAVLGLGGYAANSYLAYRRERGL